MNKAVKYLTGTMVIAFIAILGFWGFNIWVPIILGQLPSLSSFPVLLLFWYAIFAGFITFAAPCAIGILPAYITFVLEEREDIESRFKHGIKAGLWAGVGPVIVYAVVGLLLWGLSSAIQISTAVGFGQGQNYILWFSAFTKPLVIIMLLIFGIFLITGYSFETSRIYKAVKSKMRFGESKKAGYLSFGILYGVGSLGCGLLVFVPLLLLVLIEGNLVNGLIALLLYGASFGAALVVMTLLTVYSKGAFVNVLLKHGKTIKRIAGIIVLLGTIWLIIFYIRTGGLM